MPLTYSYCKSCSFPASIFTANFHSRQRFLKTIRYCGDWVKTIHFESWFLVCRSQVSSWCCDSACWTGCRNRLVALVLAAAAPDLPGSTCSRPRRGVKWTKMQKPDFECKNNASIPPVMEELEVDQDVSPGGLFWWNVSVRGGNCRRIWATAKKKVQQVLHISYVS